MTKKEVLDFQLPPRFEQIRDEHRKQMEVALILLQARTHADGIFGNDSGLCRVLSISVDKPISASEEARNELARMAHDYKSKLLQECRKRARWLRTSTTLRAAQ